MKPENTARAARLVEAIEGLPDLEKANTGKPASGYDRRVMLIEISDETDGGGGQVAGIELDQHTAKLVIEWLGGLLKVEARALGVEI